MNLSSILIRERVIREIRAFFDTRGFHEVIAPVLNAALPLEPTLYSFKTRWHTAEGERDLFLSVSPEATLKKMLAAGLGNCYSLGKSFRNLEATGPRHNPEFLMLEWYRENADATDIMRDVEELTQHLHSTVGPLAPNLKWQTVSLESALEEHAQLKMRDIIGEKALIRAMAKCGYSTENATWEQLFDQLFLNEIEPHLPRGPFFLTDFPARLSPLCRVNKDKPYLAERFEVYIAGMEIGNGNSENLDARAVRSQFEAENRAREHRGETTHPIDMDFIKALEQMKAGGKKYAGIGMGVDRLAMLISRSSDINEVEPFCIRP